MRDWPELIRLDTAMYQARSVHSLLSKTKSKTRAKPKSGYKAQCQEDGVTVSTMIHPFKDRVLFDVEISGKLFLRVRTYFKAIGRLNI